MRRLWMGAWLAAGIALWGAVSAGAAPQARAKITGVHGAVDVYMALFNVWRPGATVGQPLFLGDKVRTAPGATAKVTFYNPEGEDVMDLASETMLEIPDVPENADRITWIGMFSETLGKLTAQVTPRAPPPGQQYSFNVRTPTVVAGVRGTEFNVEYDRNTDTSFLLLKDGVLDGISYAGFAIGAISKNEGVSVNAIRAAQAAVHIRTAKDLLAGGNVKKENNRYNRLFHIAQFTTGAPTLNGAPMTMSMWGLELPFEGPGVGPDNPMVVSSGIGTVTLHLRHTGWFHLSQHAEISCYRVGNAILMRLRKGRLDFFRLDPTHKILRNGPAMNVEIFMAQPSGTDLRILDYTPKGGVTKAIFDMRNPTGPRIQAAEGNLKVLEVSR